MPTVSVRITEEERKKWYRYGPISQTIRRAMEQYDRDQKRRDVLKDLKKLQTDYPLHIDSDEIVRMIKEDRRSH